MIEKLKLAGLTENESKVYLALINNGPSLAGLISRKTGLHRRSVYDVTEMLIKKGLISYILKNNRRQFRATNPNRLIEIIKEKENIVEEIVPELFSKYNEQKEKVETNFFKGKEGVKSVIEDQLNYSEINILGASPQASDVLKYYFKWHEKKRKKKKIKLRIIATNKKIKNLPLSEIRYLPSKYSNPMAVNIYGDKTAIILWATNPIAIVIKEKEIADSYLKYFEIMWRISKKE